MGNSRGETERVRAYYEKLAGRYDKVIGISERVLFGDGRSWVCTQARGAVLEVAVGTGRNFAFYPQEVRLAGVELSPAMLEIANQRARELGREVDLRLGDAEALDFPDASFDTVVFTLSLCTIPDERKALAEAVRVLRSGGYLLWLEHVRSPLRPVRVVQQLLEPLAVRREADHLLREPLGCLNGEGMEIVQVERSKWGMVERVLARKRG